MDQILEPGMIVFPQHKSRSVAVSGFHGKLIYVEGNTGVVKYADSHSEEHDLSELQSLPNFAIIDGDLLMADTDFIAHQCNCLTSQAAGIAKDIFDRFPEANVYARRTSSINDRSRYRDFTIHGRVINLYTQIYPGKPQYGPDSRQGRLEALTEALARLGKHFNTLTAISIGFPYRMGCNMGGGHWPDYLHALCLFANHNPNIQVTIYRTTRKSSNKYVRSHTYTR